MLLTLVDAFRCPAHDEESSLVLSVERWAGPRVAEGVLGCPSCHSRYHIHRGAVEFAPDTDGDWRGHPTADPFRLAAQLSLTEPGGIILLTGRYAGVHGQLTQFVDAALVLLDSELTTAPAAVNIHVSNRLPFVDRALRAAAIDSHRGSQEFVAEVVRCMRPGGRVLATENTPLPPGLDLIARDHQEWVGVVAGRAEAVPIRRAKTSS